MKSVGYAAGFRVTSRDLDIVRWIGRLRMASAAQVATRFEMGRAVSYGRLGGLVRLGLLEHARVFHAAPGVYLATSAGIASVDLNLPPARVDLRTYDHDLELSALVIDLEREFGTSCLHTEREMRAADTVAPVAPGRQPRFAVPVATGRGELQLSPVRNPRLHFPDLAVSTTSEQRIFAIELERTAKGRSRLRRILAGYVAARHIGRVRYYVTSQRVRALVGDEISQAGAGSLIQVQAHGALAAGVEQAA